MYNTSKSKASATAPTAVLWPQEDVDAGTVSNFRQRYLRRLDIRGRSLLVSPIVKRRKNFTAQIDDLPWSPKRPKRKIKDIRYPLFLIFIDWEGTCSPVVLHKNNHIKHVASDWVMISGSKLTSITFCLPCYTRLKYQEALGKNVANTMPRVHVLLSEAQQETFLTLKPHCNVSCFVQLLSSFSKQDIILCRRCALRSLLS